MARKKVNTRSQKTKVVSTSKKSEAKQSQIEATVHRMLTQLGEDPGRHGLQDTPKRVAKALTFLTKGYQQDIDELLNGALFPIDYDEMVIVKDIDFFSLCEHHMLPFFGKCHVGYIPRKHVVGLSKIPRLVDAFSRRLQVQERLTVQIARTLQAKLNPHESGSRDGSAASLYEYARRRKTKHYRCDKRNAGSVPQATTNPGRISQTYSSRWTPFRVIFIRQFRYSLTPQRIRNFPLIPFS